MEGQTESSPIEDAQGDGAGPEASPLAQISRAMVAIYKDQFGRGPTKVRTNWCGDDMIVCVLEQSLTPAEKKMRDLNEHERLRGIRMMFQYAALKDFTAPVERITGRRVRAFISGIDSVEDVALETFLLHPCGSDAPSRAER